MDFWALENLFFPLEVYFSPKRLASLWLWYQGLVNYSGQNHVTATLFIFRHQSFIARNKTKT